jgi:hypothetical protein
MKKSARLLRVMLLVSIACLFQVKAAQDTAKAVRKQPAAQSVVKANAKSAPHEVAGPAIIGNDADTAANPAAAPMSTQAKQKTEKNVAADTTVKNEPASQPATAEKPFPSLRKPKLKSEDINTVEKMRLEAARLREEAKALRDLADTLSRSSDEAEEKADDANDKAENLEDGLKENEMHHVAHHVRLEMERIKRIIQADVERIKKLHGVSSADDSLSLLQADSLDTILTHLSPDSGGTMEQQKKLLDKIHSNSNALLEKSKEMSVKAREMEEAADDRDDMADDLTEKAEKLAEEQNPLQLSKRFPLHFGFQLRFAQVKPFFSSTVDMLLLHGVNVSYSVTPHFEAGLQDITLYWQETMFGNRYAITAAPSARLSFFPVKRLQLGATAGASMQERVGCGRESRFSVTPYVAVFNEVWVRNHFSISPVVRLNYAAYGPYYTVALSHHSGVLPQGALWLDLGIGYNFNF